MSLQISTALKKNALYGIRGNNNISLSLHGGVGKVYSGTQPASADAAVSGTLLGTVSASAGTFSPGVYQTYDVDGICASQTPVAAGNLTLNGVSGGTLSLGSYVTISGTGNESNKIFKITGTGDADEEVVEYLMGPNNNTVSSTNTYKSVTSIFCSAATAAAITVGYGITNGLLWTIPASGSIANHASQIWQMTGVAAGTMGYVRWVGAAEDTGALSTALPRIDMRISTSGAELTASNLSVVVGAVTSFDSVVITFP